MLFRKKIERRCEYCRFSTKLVEDQMLCSKKGIRSADSACLRFAYDPCKRIPLKPKSPDFSLYEETDFSL